MLPQEIIRKKRDKQVLSKEEIEDFINGVTSKDVSEAQIASFAMAVLLNGMDLAERVALTMAMAHSGDTLDWSGHALDGPVLDKHSTGGVGDKVSLMLAPIMAACGAFVPMISGRGLGHTGGTLDKMDAIPGYISQPEIETFQAVVKNTGLAIVGATGEFAPADKTIYAVRDISGTVESLDLITASILSKKLAAGLEALVLDVKFGSGAFMQDYDDAKELAESLVGVANGAGLKCSALMTDMNQVLGRTAGNAIEVRESIEFLRNENVNERLYEVVISLCAELLVLGKIADSADEGRALAESNLKNGRAADFFARSVEALGGPPSIVEKYQDHLPLAKHKMEVFPDEEGAVLEIDTRQIGIAVIELGGGRRQTSDAIDYAVGLSNIVALGEQVSASGKPLLKIHGNDEGKMNIAAEIIKKAIRVGDKAKSNTAIVSERVGP